MQTIHFLLMIPWGVQLSTTNMTEAMSSNF